MTTQKTEEDQSKEKSWNGAGRWRKGKPREESFSKRNDRKEANLFKGVQVFKKLNTELPYQPTILLQSIYLR